MEPIIILGMHRSGTSLVAEILQKTGVFIGADLDDNFESVFFVRLNEWIFFQSGASWDNPKNMTFLTEDFISDTEQNLRRKMKSVKAIRYLGSFEKYLKYKSLNKLGFTWAWKDPRNVFTFDIWRRIFPKSKVIIVNRNPIDVVLSLKNREINIEKLRDTKTRTGIKKKFDEFFLANKRIYKNSLRVFLLDEGIKLWEEYVGNIYSTDFSGHQVHYINYEELIEQPQREIEKLVEFAGNQPDAGKISQASKLVKKRPAYSFVSNHEMLDLYRTIQHLPTVEKAGYHNII
jgi:hypothetical protein